MTDLSPSTAFGLTTPRETRYPAITVTEVTGRSFASVALPAGDRDTGILGTPMAPAGTFRTNGSLTVIWTGPDQWLVEDAASSDLCARLATAMPEAAITDQTDGWVALDITAQSPDALHRLLEKLANIDLSAFGAGSALRTGLHHMSVFVIRRSATSLTVMGMRSAAGTVWHAVTSAAKTVA